MPAHNRTPQPPRRPNAETLARWAREVSPVLRDELLVSNSGNVVTWRFVSNYFIQIVLPDAALEHNRTRYIGRLHYVCKAENLLEIKLRLSLN